MPAVDLPATQRRRNSPRHGSSAPATRVQANRSTTCTALPSGKARCPTSRRPSTCSYRYCASGDPGTSRAESMGHSAASSARSRAARDSRPLREPVGRSPIDDAWVILQRWCLSDACPAIQVAAK